MPEYPGFIGGSYVSLSPDALNERTVNFYVERMESPFGQSRLALYPTPGVVELSEATGSPGRGHFYQDDREFAVIGTTFYEFDVHGTMTSRGTVAVDSNPATICSNGPGGGQVFVTSGDRGYIFDLTTNILTQVRASATTMGDHLDGFFLAFDAATSTVFLSDLLDGTTWDPTQFLQRSIRPDPWVSMIVWDRYIWLFGTETTEVWYNAGTTPIPFQPHPSGLVLYGTAAAFSPKVAGGALMWLGRTANGQGDVLRASGFTPEVVSTFGVHPSVDAYHRMDLAAAVGDTYEELGHAFYVLTIPRSGTWVYDATPSLQLPPAVRWAERGTWISEDNAYAPWRPQFHAFAFGEHRMLDRETGSLYRLTHDTLYDVDDRPVRRLRRPPALWAHDGRLFVSEFEVALEPGLGLVSGQGSDPQVALRISRDAGKTFGHERSRSAGTIGQYTHRTTWSRCGSVKKGSAFQPEIIMTDPTPYRLMGARIRTSGAAVRRAA